MSVELPKDAKGREIPLDTECLYTYKDEKQDVLSFTYDRREDIWEIETDMRMVNSIYLYLTPLDSWKRLFEDLDRCIAGDNICLYCSPSGRCSDCANEPNGACDAKVLELVMERIKRLRGED